MKVPKDYLETQTNESSTSRGTQWGYRARWSVDQYLKYFKGKILEVGCNDGFATEYIQGKGFEVKGIDIAEHKLKVAKGHGLKVRFGYQEKIPFGDKSFDTIFSSHTLEHSYDIKKALDEYQRVARRAIIVVPIERGKESDEVHCSLFENKEEFEKLFVDRGKILLSEPRHRLQKEHVIIIDFN